MRPNNHIDGQQGCPYCCTSKGEARVNDWLTEQHIQFNREYKFSELLSDKGNPLRFDFYIPSVNLCIEYDGEQHTVHKKSWMSKDEFDRLQVHDIRKTVFCMENNISLLRIPWTDKNNIENILETHFQYVY